MASHRRGNDLALVRSYHLLACLAHVNRAARTENDDEPLYLGIDTIIDFSIPEGFLHGGAMVYDAIWGGHLSTPT